ncbi:SMI1/KNR4 family protein [Priestia megaterium]
MDQSIIYPLPDDTVLSEKEGKWRINLPETYKEFVKKYNGGTPIKNRFKCSNYMYMIDRFLCILNITGERDDECYDIGAVRTQLELLMSGLKK